MGTGRQLARPGLPLLSELHGVPAADRSEPELRHPHGPHTRYNKQSWKAQVDPVTYTKWQPRKPPTGTWPLLRKTGLMQNSAKFYTEQGKKGMFYAETVYYGPFMQYGTSTVPARRWLGIGPKMLDPMAKVIRRHIFRRGKVTLTAG